MVYAQGSIISFVLSQGDPVWIRLDNKRYQVLGWATVVVSQLGNMISTCLVPLMVPSAGGAVRLGPVVGELVVEAPPRGLIR